MTTKAVGGNAPVALNYLANANVGAHRGQIDFVVLYIRNQATNVNYTTGEISFTPSGPLLDDGSVPDQFTITGEDNVLVYPLTARGNKKGPPVGTICVGDMVYTRAG